VTSWTEAVSLRRGALSDRNVSDVDREHGFDRSGAFAKAGSAGTPAIAGVLAFTGMDLTVGSDPVLFLHPRFEGALPTGLLQLEVRTLTPDGPRARPPSVKGIFARLSSAAGGG